MSYPLYLVHQRIGVAVMEAFYRHGIPAVGALVLATLGVGALATVIHFAVETPGRRFLRKLLAGPPVSRRAAIQAEAAS